jgi:bacterial/archaeal transporter family protein
MNISLSWWMYALLSAVFAALTTIFAKIGVESIDSNLATAIRTVFILLVAWGIVFAQGQLESLSNIPVKTLLFLGFSGIATGFSWIFYFKALQIGKASFVAPIDKSSLVLIVLFSAVFLNEPFTQRSLLGTLLITIGTLIFIL